VRRARTGLISLPSLPSLSDVKNGAKKKFDDTALGNFRDTILAELISTLNTAKSTLTSSLNSVATDAGQWASTAVSNELPSLSTTVDTLKSDIKTQIAAVQTSVANTKATLGNMLKTLKSYFDNPFSLNANYSCTVPNVVSQLNQLVQDYAGASNFISQQQWCHFVAILNKVDPKASAYYNTRPSFASTTAAAKPAGAALVELLENVRTIRVTNFVELSAGVHVQVGGANYNCPLMLEVSRGLEAGFTIGNLALAAIDSNADDIAQPLAFGASVLLRLCSMIMRAICASSKDFSSCSA